MMTYTLTSERSLIQIRRAAAEWLPGAIIHGPGEPSGSAYGMEDRTTVAPRRYPSFTELRGLTDKPQEYVVGHQPYQMIASTYTWHIKPHEGKGFEGLAAILASAQEPAGNNWWSFFLPLDEESPVSATSERLLFHIREAFAVTWVHWELQEWALFAYQLARELLPADVQAPQRVADPENEAEWWLAIVAKCRGSVASILTAYDNLVERFVAEVPAQARDRIRFEIQVDD